MRNGLADMKAPEPQAEVLPQPGSQGTDPSMFHEALMRLEDAGIKSCLLRDDPDTLDTLDELDLLVPRDQLMRAAEILQTCGWEVWGADGCDPLKIQLVCMDKNVLRKIDLHGALVAGGLVYIDDDWFWARVIPYAPAINVPAAEAFLLHCIMHVILSKPQLPRKYAARLVALVDTIDTESLLLQARRYGLGGMVGEALGDPISTLGDPRCVSRLRRSAVAVLLGRHPGNVARSVAGRARRVLSCFDGARAGLLIALVGPDGAGKTSFIAALHAEIAARFDLAARSAYMGPWDRHVLPSSKLLARVDASPLDELEEPDAPRWRRRLVSRIDSTGTLRRTVYYANLPFEMWARYIWRVKRHQVLSRVVIADRYVYDLEVGFRNVPVRNAPSLRRLICHLLPRPDVTILLYNDPEIIWGRKSEYPAVVIREALEAYRQISPRWDFRPVCTDRSPAELAASFVTQNWRNIVRRQSARSLQGSWNFSSPEEHPTASKSSCMSDRS
ncbi:MAG: Thymidylate kinaselike protein [Hyphomicrobiales bacterium]|nr:Thymidylate kinaselike protein [Hyphomicrobiales bacterium]